MASLKSAYVYYAYDHQRHLLTTTSLQIGIVPQLLCYSVYSKGAVLHFVCCMRVIRSNHNATYARNRCTSLKRSAIKEYFDDRCQGDTKGEAFWKTIRPFLANKGENQNTIVLRENDDIKTNTSDVCDIFYEHYQCSSIHWTNAK